MTSCLDFLAHALKKFKFGFVVKVQNESVWAATVIFETVLFSQKSDPQFSFKHHLSVPNDFSPLNHLFAMIFENCLQNLRTLAFGNQFSIEAFQKLRNIRELHRAVRVVIFADVYEIWCEV